jgi:antirestriction protein
MKIAVSTYHNYNSGHLDFIWIDTQKFIDKDGFYKGLDIINSQFWKEDDPEYMFQDYEDIPECFISESWVSEYVFTINDILDNTGVTLEQLTSYCDDYGYDLEKEDIYDIISKIEDNFFCHKEDFEEMCWHFAEESYGKQIIESGYFDITRYMRDTELSMSVIDDFYYYQH